LIDARGSDGRRRTRSRVAQRFVWSNKKGYIGLRSGDRADDVRITGVDDAKGRHSVKLTARSAQLDVATAELMDGGLGQHRIVLDLALSQCRAVVRDDNQLALARAQSLQGLLVAEVVLACKSKKSHENRTDVRDGVEITTEGSQVYRANCKASYGSAIKATHFSCGKYPSLIQRQQG
jgi:hypothetical protein